MDRSIGQASVDLGLSQDTLRYYERIGLVAKITKDRSGRRSYSDRDLAGLRFVQRAQGVGFSLEEIAQLLKLRASPTKSSRTVRAMAQEKCQAMREQMQALQHMQDELGALLNLCDGNSDHCPILEGLDGISSQKDSCCEIA
jgi:DNA-binding transcriptional MerR regulator